MTVVRKFDSNDAGVKGIGKVCQLMERCDGHGGGVRGCRKVCHLSRSVTVLREVKVIKKMCQWM